LIEPESELQDMRCGTVLLPDRYL